VVRGLAAVLGVGIAAQLYFLLAPSLPVIDNVDVSICVAFSVGAAFTYALIAGVVPVSDSPPLLWLMTAGGLLLMAGFNVADFGAAATPIEAIAYAGFGAVFAVGLLAPSLAIALPLFVSGIDIISTFAGGPSETLGNAGITQRGDALSLEMPDWGTHLPAGRIGISDAVFAGVFLLYVRRYGLRPRATAVGLWVAAVAAIVLKVWLDRAIPLLPLSAAAYFLVNLDRMPALLRASSEA
jgi:hypothetical protein